MFGWFKKKPPLNALDALMQVAYGVSKSMKADPRKAIDFAYTDLLQQKIARSEVEKIAKNLNDGSIPYSTYDLALSVALNFFRRPDLHNVLFDAQLFARMKLIEWLNEGGVNPMLASAFENTLYKTFKPQLEEVTPSENDNGSDFNPREKIEPQLRKFFTRQHNTLMSAVSFSGFDLEMDFDKKLQESAFLIGALVAAKPTEDDYYLILKSILYTCFPEDAEQILLKATDLLQDEILNKIMNAGYAAFHIHNKLETSPEYAEELLFAVDFSSQIDSDCFWIDGPENIVTHFSDLLDLGEELKQTNIEAPWLLQIALLTDALQNNIDDPNEDIISELIRFERFFKTPQFDELNNEDLQEKLLSICGKLIAATGPKAAQ